jgi:hypothetical protein
MTSLNWFLTLALLVPGILTNDPDRAFAPNHAAVAA